MEQRRLGGDLPHALRFEGHADRASIDALTMFTDMEVVEMKGDGRLHSIVLRNVKAGATLQTSTPGVYATGDVRSGSTEQVASAAGEGATAALMLRGYLEEGSAF